METTYCPNCAIKMIVRDVRDDEIHCCANCGKVFMKKGDRYHFIYQTSGNNALREFFAFIDQRNI